MAHTVLEFGHIALLELALPGQSQATQYAKHIAHASYYTVLLELARPGQAQTTQYGKTMPHTAS